MSKKLSLGLLKNLNTNSTSIIPNNSSVEEALLALDSNAQIGYVNVLSYEHLVVNNDWTAAINSAIISGSIQKKSTYLPGRSSPYLCNGRIHVLAQCTLFGDEYGTVIRRPNSGTDSAQIQVYTKATVRGITIDGNGTNQTVDCFGVLGYQVRDSTIERVNVSNTFGIGIGWSSCANMTSISCHVDGVRNSKPGIWCDRSEVEESFYWEGGHIYQNCSSTNSQLDGVIIGVDNCTFIGGNYSDNGYGGDFQGALGAGGIYGVDGRTLKGLKVIGVRANHNSEFGLNYESDEAVIIGNHCSNNQLSGILSRGGSGQTISNNVCTHNGWYTGSAYPDGYVRAGIIFFSKTSYSTISNNVCTDDLDNDPIQQWGIYFSSTAEGSSPCAGMIIQGNQTRFNITDNDNINPSGYTYANLTNLKYGDFFNGEKSILASTSTTPSVGNGLRFIRVTEDLSINNFTNGVNTQEIVVFSEATVTVLNNANIGLTGSSNVVLTPGSTLTLALLSGRWQETARSIR